MNDKTYNTARSRELRRFHRAVDQAIDQLLSEKYEQTRSVEEYRKYTADCAFVKNLMSSVDRMADKSGALFARQGERTAWEVYLSGLRKLYRDLPDSYLFRFVLPMFGLEDLQEKMVAYSGRWLDGLHAAHQFFTEAERYLGHLELGEEILAEYEATTSGDLARLYASLKTWETKEEVDGFFTALAEFIDTTCEVVVSGPVQLYLMLGRDTFTVIFKALSVGRLGDMREGDEEYVELLGLQDFVHDLVENSTSLALLREVSARAGKAYVRNLREESDRLRGQLPTQDMQRGFIRRYEAGVLFRREEAEL